MDRKDVFPRSVQYLIAIAEYGSYSRAAEALHVSQPTMSQQIKQLEASLKSPLFNRSGRTVRLTDAGEIFLRHAHRARGELDAGRRAIHDVHNLSRGSLRLGWTPITDHLTCSLLEVFNSRYPGITLSTLEMPQDDIEMAVSEDRIDVGITFSKQRTAEARSSEIESNLLFEEALCVAVGNAHPRAGQTEAMSAREFGQESLALLNTDFALRRHIDQYCHKHGVEPRIGIETNSLSVIIEMIQSGPLATVLPNSIVRTQCGLYGIGLAPKMPEKAITLIRKKGQYKSPACMAFAEIAMDWVTRRTEETPMRWRIPCPLSEVLYQNKLREAETHKTVRD
jgi:LysR family cyn operon transcriptional activator